MALIEALKKSQQAAVKPPDYSMYATNQDAGNAEIARLGQVYNANKVTNKTASNDAHTQANAIRDAMGVSHLYNRTDGSLLKPNVIDVDHTVNETKIDQGYAPQNNNSDLIKSLYDSMYASQAQRLKAQRDSQLAGLAGQDDLIKQQGQSALNANDVSGARLADQLRERMANLGLLQGGDFISGQIAQNTAQGENANQINMDMGNRLQQLLAQKDAINNNASADDNALLQSIQAQMAQAQIGQNNADRSFGLEEAGLTGQYNGGQTLAARNADRGYGLDLAGLSGQLPGGGQTLQAKQFDYNVGIDSRDFDYKKAQDSWANSFAKEQFTEQKAAQKWEQTFKTNSFQQDMKDAAASRGLQWASLSQRDKEFIADSAYREKTYAADQKQREIDNGKKNSAEEYSKYVDGVARFDKNPLTGASALSNPEDVEKSILQSDLPETEMKKLYSRYGLKWGG